MRVKFRTNKKSVFNEGSLLVEMWGFSKNMYRLHMRQISPTRQKLLQTLQLRICWRRRRWQWCIWRWTKEGTRQFVEVEFKFMSLEQVAKNLWDDLCWWYSNYVNKIIANSIYSPFLYTNQFDSNLRKNLR